MITSNYLIINKKPQKFSTMRMAGKAAVFIGADGRPVDFGVLALDDSIYTMLVCREFRLAMLVIDRHGERRVQGIFWLNDDDFEGCVRGLSEAAGLRPSVQDTKINSYAWSIAKKLDQGVRVKVTDAVDESEMTVCPECGMLNPKGSEYCLDCGAELLP